MRLSDGDNFEVLDENNNAILLYMRKCSCRMWEVYSLSYKHSCVSVMQTDANVHHYVVEYFTVKSYHYAYARPIYTIPDHDKPTDENHDLRIWSLVIRTRPGCPKKEEDRIKVF